MLYSTTMQRLLRVAGAGTVILALSGCSGAEKNNVVGPNPNPTVGSIQVGTATSGSDIDADGYRVTMDGGSERTLGASGVVTFTDVTTGDHDIELTDVASNCTVSGANPRSVIVAAGATTQTAFDVTCSATTGSIEVSVATSGTSVDTDGYEVTVDNGQSMPLGTNGSASLSGLSAGSHDVEINDVVSNCTVAGSNPRSVSVTAGATAQVAFDVSCVPPPLGTIAFVSDRSGGDQVFTMNGAGGDVIQVTSSANGYKERPMVSPDGAKIAFEADLDIWVVNADGTGLLNVSNDPSQARDPRWSPNSGRIAFDSRRDDPSPWAFYLVDADGANLARLAGLDALISLGYITANPSWSPDGSKIAFNTFENSGDDDIYLINADGTGLTNLTNTSGLSEWDPRWSPGGSRIAFSRWPGASVVEPYLMNSDGTSVTPLLTSLVDAGRPNWSPDGSKLVFTTGPCSNDCGVYVVNADGSGLTKLTTFNALFDESGWSHDGSKIVFSTDIDGNWEIYTVNPDGTGLVNITHDPADDRLWWGSWGP